MLALALLGVLACVGATESGSTSTSTDVTSTSSSSSSTTADEGGKGAGCDESSSETSSSGSAGGGHHVGLETAVVFPTLCIIVGVISQWLLGKVAPWMPYTPFLLIIGILMKVIDHTAPTYEHVAKSIQTWEHMDGHLLLYTFLPPLVFGDAMFLSWHTLAKCLAQCALLAIPGVLLGTSIFAVVAKTVLPYDWPWHLCFAFGSVMSATDPVAVVGLLNQLGAPASLTMIIGGESLLNDGSAMVVWTVRPHAPPLPRPQNRAARGAPSLPPQRRPSPTNPVSPPRSPRAPRSPPPTRVRLPVHSMHPSSAAPSFAPLPTQPPPVHSPHNLASQPTAPHPPPLLPHTHTLPALFIQPHPIPSLLDPRPPHSRPSLHRPHSHTRPPVSRAPQIFFNLYLETPDFNVASKIFVLGLVSPIIGICFGLVSPRKPATTRGSLSTQPRTGLPFSLGTLLLRPSRKPGHGPTPLWQVWRVWLGAFSSNLDHTNGVTQTVLTVFGAYACFYVAEGMIEASGVMAVVCMGGVLAATFWPVLADPGLLRGTWHTLEWAYNTVLFQLTGLVIGSKFIAAVDAESDCLQCNGFDNSSNAIWCNLRGAGYDSRGRDGELTDAECSALNLNVFEDLGWAVLLYIFAIIIRSVVVIVFFPLLQRLGYGLSVQGACVAAWGGLRGAVGLALALVMKTEMAELERADQNNGVRIIIYVATTAVYAAACDPRTGGAPDSLTR